MRDEIGFMAIHHAFANRFFPGTSVLHTRLRYLFFVPWIMQQVAAERGSAPLSEYLKRGEAIVKDQLIEGRAGTGIIGARSPRRRMPSQVPSAVYWNALQKWGLVRAHDEGSYPSRLDALKSLAEISDAEKRHSRDDDGVAIDELISPFFDGLPTACKEFLTGNGRLSFALEGREKRFLIDAISSASAPARNSIFARLIKEKSSLPEPKSVEYDIVTGWPTWIRDLCDNEERKALKIASHAAALACIGRAIYAALVQTLRKEDGAASGETDHCKLLDQAIHKYGTAACSLEIDNLKALFSDEPLPSPIITVLTKTKAWLKIGRRKNFMALRNLYCSAETPPQVRSVKTSHHSS